MSKQMQIGTLVRRRSSCAMDSCGELTHVEGRYAVVHTPSGRIIDALLSDLVPIRNSELHLSVGSAFARSGSNC